MLVAERHIIKKGHRFWAEIDNLSWQSKNLYNSANYLIRQNFIYGQTTEKPVFSGKRISRALYRTDKGILVQSDVMGSYNILRKAFPNAFNRYGIERCVVHPRRINLSK